MGRESASPIHAVEHCLNGRHHRRRINRNLAGTLKPRRGLDRRGGPPRYAPLGCGGVELVFPAYEVRIRVKRRSVARVEVHHGLQVRLASESRSGLVKKCKV